MGNCITRTLVIGDPDGIHLRPAALLAKAAGTFNSRVSIRYQEGLANGESTLEILALGAVTGAGLIFEACGPDANETLDALARIVLDNQF